jgi:hypothetical protein
MATPFNAGYTYPQHRLSITDNLRAGNAVSAAGQLNGVPVVLRQFENLGNVGVAVANNILTAYTAAALVTVPPNAHPIGGSLAVPANSTTGGLVATMDFPRTVSVVSNNAGDTTQTVLISGFDYYGAAMSQLLSLNGETAVVTLKAFMSVASITFSALTAGAVTVGTGAAIGLSYLLATGNIPVGSYVTTSTGVAAADAGTVVVPDPTSPATNLTGDVRGTYLPATTEAAATTTFYLEYVTLGGPTNAQAFGVTQA